MEGAITVTLDFVPEADSRKAMRARDQNLPGSSELCSLEATHPAVTSPTVPIALLAANRERCHSTESDGYVCGGQHHLRDEFPRIPFRELKTVRSLQPQSSYGPAARW